MYHGKQRDFGKNMKQHPCKEGCEGWMHGFLLQWKDTIHD